MTRIKYDADILKYMSLFESITRARLKDCIVDNGLTFIVEEGQLGKAIGKNAVNVRMLEKILKKRIRIIEFNEDVTGFIKNLIYPINAQDINKEDRVVIIAVVGIDAKSRLIGRDRKNIDNVKSIVKRYFDIEEIKIV